MKPFISVVYLLIPTSNHNTTKFINSNFRCISFDSYIKPQRIWVHYVPSVCCISFDSYIKPQLILQLEKKKPCCISFDSYIKPQPCGCCACRHSVVYLLIPTSNHNPAFAFTPSSLLYIFWFLHQTTTTTEFII